MFPELGEPVERLIRFMANVLAIEVFAASTFAWAEEILSDPEVSDAPDDAANLVRYIRSDEAPHVEYLRTALSEIQARTLLTLDGKPISGRKVVNDLAERGIRTMLRQRLNERPAMVRDLIRRTAKVQGHRRVDARVRRVGDDMDAASAIRGFGARSECRGSGRVLSTT